VRERERERERKEETQKEKITHLFLSEETARDEKQQDKEATLDKKEQHQHSSAV
jgi:hypothetical protein